MVNIQEITQNPETIKVFTEVEVTPEVAEKLLERNKRNRPVSTRQVRYYSKQMKKGQWIYNGDILRLSKTGELIDGQHRLYAIVDSNTTQVMNIMTGLSDDVFSSIDLGKNRTTYDILNIRGYANGNVLAGASRIVLYYDNDLMKVDVAGIHGGRLSTKDILKFVDSENNADVLQEYIQFANNLYSSHKEAKIVSPSTIAGFTYLFARTSQEKAYDFFTRLVTGDGISSTQYSPIYRLREKMIGWQISRNYSSVERFACIIKAWNAYISGREMARLFWKKDEAFPTVL